MLLKNGLVVDENFKLKKLDVKIDNGKISAVSENLSGNGIDLNELLKMLNQKVNEN